MTTELASSKPFSYDEEVQFMPNLCDTQAVFVLILVSELLSIVLVIANKGVAYFDWLHFGMVSFLVQWIVLCSAAIICSLRPWFHKRTPAIAGVSSFAIVIITAFVFSLISQAIMPNQAIFSCWEIMNNLIITSVLAGIFLRYFYVRQCLHIQEQAALQARFQALQSRIHPHFLFNSMNSIASLISIDAKKAEDLVVDLAELFRASLKEPSLVALVDDIRICQRFVDIEQVRLGDRLRVLWNIDPHTQQAIIPSLMLQPIIENAIYHGIQPLENGGKLTIDVSMAKTDVVIKVTNPRIAGEELSHAQRHRKTHINTHVFEGNGMAMHNIRHRLDAQYGRAASMRIVKGVNDFTIVLRFPMTTTAVQGKSL